MSDKVFIKVWCEYDFSGNFGWDNNEDVFEVYPELVHHEVEERVVTFLKGRCRVSEEDLEDLFSWEFITIAGL
ncbi:hypothetical protein VPBG_00180 [Vibrio phage helene 12B3]|uniref:hypothetical protein n=1 Tax=Vibrio phage helene 12B3 TaxID=573173 RepID=UPI0002C073FA|nr:hypothetical protein VPBG_00180 [Vibrio phage helene 12B3]YP_009223049.1 hypothetical protein VPLG_00200 [Vibrio phage eugene 12A10]AGG57952.1 hypothetical protein VPBG_00180 [Vibrio phage helene 12B3]AGN51639.1 hypothetical protein VPLG_00200 [Vibrio phage eugene 12A10]